MATLGDATQIGSFLFLVTLHKVAKVIKDLFAYTFAVNFANVKTAWKCCVAVYLLAVCW